MIALFLCESGHSMTWYDYLSWIGATESFDTDARSAGFQEDQIISNEETDAIHVFYYISGQHGTIIKLLLPELM